MKPAIIRDDIRIPMLTRNAYEIAAGNEDEAIDFAEAQGIREFFCGEKIFYRHWLGWEEMPR